MDHSRAWLHSRRSFLLAAQEAQRPPQDINVKKHQHPVIAVEPWGRESKQRYSPSDVIFFSRKMTEVLFQNATEIVDRCLNERSAYIAAPTDIPSSSSYWPCTVSAAFISLDYSDGINYRAVSWLLKDLERHNLLWQKPMPCWRRIVRCRSLPATPLCFR